MSADDRLEKVPEIAAALRSISTGHALSNDLCMDVGWRTVCSLGADLLERVAATEARLARLQVENEELMDALNGYCWCCVNAKKLEKAPLESRIRTCEHLRENGVVASSGRRNCQHWKWRGAQEEG